MLDGTAASSISTAISKVQTSIGAPAISNVGSSIADAIGNNYIYNLFAGGTPGSLSITAAIGSIAIDNSVLTGAAATSISDGLSKTQVAIGNSNIGNVGSSISNAIGNTDMTGVTAPETNSGGAAIRSISDVIGNANIGTTLSQAIANLQTSVGTIPTGDTSLTSISLLGTTTSAATTLSDESSVMNSAVSTAIGNVDISGATGAAANTLSISDTIGNTDISNRIVFGAYANSLSEAVSYLQQSMGDTENNNKGIAKVNVASNINYLLNAVGFTGGDGDPLAYPILLGSSMNVPSAIGTDSISSVGLTLASAIGNVNIGTSLSQAIATLQTSIGTTPVGTIPTGDTSLTSINLLSRTTAAAATLSDESSVMNSAVQTAIGTSSITNVGSNIAAAIGNTAITGFGTPTISGAIGAGILLNNANSGESISSAIGNTILLGSTGAGMSLAAAIGDTGIVGQQVYINGGTSIGTSIAAAIGNNRVSNAVIGNSAPANTLTDAINSIQTAIGNQAISGFVTPTIAAAIGTGNLLGTGGAAYTVGTSISAAIGTTPLLGSYGIGMSIAQALGDTGFLGQQVYINQGTSIGISFATAIGDNPIMGTVAGGEYTGVSISAAIGNAVITVNPLNRGTETTLSDAVVSLNAAIGSASISNVGSNIANAIGNTDIGSSSSLSEAIGDSLTPSTKQWFSTGYGTVGYDTVVGTFNDVYACQYNTAFSCSADVLIATGSSNLVEMQKAYMECSAWAYAAFNLPANQPYEGVPNGEGSGADYYNLSDLQYTIGIRMGTTSSCNPVMNVYNNDATAGDLYAACIYSLIGVLPATDVAPTVC